MTYLTRPGTWSRQSLQSVPRYKQYHGGEEVGAKIYLRASIKQRRELTVEKLHPKVILTFCFLFECTLFPRKRGCSRLKKAGIKDRDRLGLKHAAWKGWDKMLDVTCMLTCTAGVLVQFQLRKSFWKTNIFFVFSRTATECQKQRILPKTQFNWVNQEMEFSEFRVENISEVFCEKKQGNLLNGRIQNTGWNNETIILWIYVFG